MSALRSLRCLLGFHTQMTEWEPDPTHLCMQHRRCGCGHVDTREQHGPGVWQQYAASPRVSRNVCSRCAHEVLHPSPPQISRRLRRP
jgi:hypothetical protein